jgi:hypothetical protein
LLAEREAAEYANILDGVSYVGLAQCFALGVEPDSGSEIFSLTRDSDLSPEAYISRFFDTGGEHQNEI